jgi:hypothetical protein
MTVFGAPDRPVDVSHDLDDTALSRGRVRVPLAIARGKVSPTFAPRPRVLLGDDEHDHTRDEETHAQEPD